MCQLQLTSMSSLHFVETVGMKQPHFEVKPIDIILYIPRVEQFLYGWLGVALHSQVLITILIEVTFSDQCLYKYSLLY